MRTINQKIEERITRWLPGESEELLFRIRCAIKDIPYNGDETDKDAINRYCLSRIADGMNEFLHSSNFSAVFKQKKYEKYINLLTNLSHSHHIEDSAPFIDLIDIPLTEDPGIALVKALHGRDRKTKEELSEELGISERMVRLNIRKLDHRKVVENGVSPGEFRIGGQLVSVSVSDRIEKDGKITYYTPNTMHPIVLQLNLYQTAVMLDSLWKEYEEESGIAIELAASIWGQLSEYAKDRIRFVWGSYKEGFEDFLDQIEELLEDGIETSFQEEKNLFLSDNASMEDKLQIASKERKYVNISFFDGMETLKKVLIKPNGWKDGKFSYYAYYREEEEENGIPFFIEDVKDIALAYY